MPELLLFVIALAMLFVKLGIGEFESSDEALYVVRALAIEKFGVWLDQSQYALGGFYSSTHPPLGVWLITISRALFGEGEFATRLPLALAGVVASIALLTLLRRVTTNRVALLLSASFAACTLFSWYARHAQLDSLLIACSLWALVFLHKSLDRQSLSLAAFAGLFFGLALMSKFLWGGFIAPYFLIAVALSQSPIRYKAFLTMLGVTVLVAAPWYVYMIVKHPDFLSHFLQFSTVKGYEIGNEKTISFYLNQLLVNAPFVVLAIMALVRERRSREVMSYATWLLIVFIGLELMLIKMPHFVLLLLPAAYLLSGAIIEKKDKLPLWMWGILTFAVLWSLSGQIRLLAKGAAFEYMAPNMWTVGSAGVVLIGLLAYSWRRRTRSGLMFLALTGIFVLTSAIKVTGYEDQVFRDGAGIIGSRLEKLQYRINHLVILHSSLPHEDLTSRIAYYTDGWTEGWIPGQTTKLRWDDSNAVEDLSKLIDERTAVVIERDWDRFYVPQEDVRQRMIELKQLLRSRYNTYESGYDSLRSYDVFY